MPRKTLAEIAANPAAASPSDEARSRVHVGRYELQPRERAAEALRLDGWQDAKIAGALNVSPLTVKRWLNRGKVPLPAPNRLDYALACDRCCGRVRICSFIVLDAMETLRMTRADEAQAHFIELLVDEEVRIKDAGAFSAYCPTCRRWRSFSFAGGWGNDRDDDPNARPVAWEFEAEARWRLRRRWRRAIPPHLPRSGSGSL